MILLGLLLGLVGTDVNSGLQRFTFGIPELSDGISFVAVAMGVFGFAEIIVNLEQTEKRGMFAKSVSRALMPTRARLQAASLGRSCAAPRIGSMLGILPGGGAMLSPFAAYTLEKKIAKDPSRFGKGAIEGVAGRKRQQRRRADVVHPDADARHSVERGDGADDRRNDHPLASSRARRS